MSAFRLHKETILPVLFCGVKNFKREAVKILEQYQCIVEANRLSLCARYGSDDKFEPADSMTIAEIWSCYCDFDLYHPDLVQIIKFCHCIDYQNCEFDSYGNHRAAKIVRGKKVHAYLMLDKSARTILPGWDAKKWDY